MMNKDNLNLKWWRGLLITTALKRFKTKTEAAEALGVTRETLSKWSINGKTKRSA